MKKLIFIFLLFIGWLQASAFGSGLWLPHAPSGHSVAVLGIDPNTDTRKVCFDELKAYSQLDTVRLEIASGIPAQGFEIKRLGTNSAVIKASTDQGLLYGTYEFLRRQATGQPLDCADAPKVEKRLLNHWDNLDGTIERGYAGRSLWQWQDLPQTLSPRYKDYARACASVGINGTVLNNVNASSQILSTDYLQKVAALADVFRPYGIKVYLSVNFASPMQLGGLPTADSLAPQVQQWWRDKADEIYALIPDFGGFLVKANSEGQPGPCDYKRTHAQGANMLARALKPHGGEVMWRAFVYSPNDADRAKQAYNEFKPLDGKFDSNVIIQIKNGPIDFQPREPYSPLFGAMSKTRQMPEFQITQEYLGHSNHLAFLAPMWQEFFQYVDYKRMPAIAGVANVGDDANWTGHPMAQANWYAFGRVAWNPELDSRELAEEWLRQSDIVRAEEAVAPIADMMEGSHEAVVNYMMPMGLHHIFAYGHHYGPEPWCDVPGARADWLPKYYHQANKDGIGFDRSKRGSNAVGQYPSKFAKEVGNIDTCPEKFLLWFHHAPWGHRLSSGQTVWEALCRHYDQGVRQAEDMCRTWQDLEWAINPAAFADIEQRLRTQQRDAHWWHDACLQYFQQFSEMPFPQDIIPMCYDLKDLQQVDLGISNYECPSAELLNSKLHRAPFKFKTKNGTEISLLPISNRAVRVQMLGDKCHQLPEYLYLDNAEVVEAVPVLSDNGNFQLKMKELTVDYDFAADRLTFLDVDGNVLLQESPGSRKITPSIIQGEPTYDASVSFLSPADECIFGTGQFQDGYLNVRGLTRRLTQVNTQISLPFVISNKGYGLLWNNYGLTDFNPSANSLKLESAGATGPTTTVDVTTDKGNARETRQNNVFEGVIEITEPGDYAFLLDVGKKMARKHYVEIDDSVYVSIDNIWLPPTTSFIANMVPGKHKIKVQGVNGDAPTIGWRPFDGTTEWHSPVSAGVDYTVFAGNADEAIGAYRQATGTVPMMPRWALGYVHCRERYNTQAELLENAAEFRQRGIPIDAIVQDWQYWGKYGWNAMRFDEEKYPDPKVMVDSLHHMDIKLMISVWSKIDKNAELGAVASEKGYYLPGAEWIDFFNSEAADFYWSKFRDRLLLPYGIDSWWQDATEPENDDLAGRRINNGQWPGEALRNIYPMFVNNTVYNGLRKDCPQKRASILTRSAFPGMQRYGVTTWSGDVGHDWQTLRRQIAGGLGQMASGLPWWTYDAGGFFRPSDQYTNPEYHEQYLRWLQTAVFLPMMRTHGYMSQTEPWRYGETVDSLSRKAIALRYSLLPYTYSCTADVSCADGTLMRPLVFDFATDSVALQQDTEFMFGPSILVVPVVDAGEHQRSAYLPTAINRSPMHPKSPTSPNSPMNPKSPTTTDWYDFYTGQKHAGGQTIMVDTPLDRIPVFVRAGSIIPMKQGMLHSADRANEPMEIHIYPGADAQFTLYEDEGDGYGCEQGEFSLIRLIWYDAKHQLTIGQRQGEYPGMAASRSFRIYNLGNQVDEIEYNGNEIIKSL